jgi:hypothetical protein
MFIIAAATTDLAGVLERAGHGGSAFGDLSIFSRIVAPVVVLPQYMLAEPFGVAFSKLGDALYPFMLNTSVDPLEITHTALFNVFFEFGFIGIPIILSLFFAARRPILICYLFLSCCFNGSLLAPDKFAVIAFAFLVHESMRAAKPTLRDDKITKLAPSLA